MKRAWGALIATVLLCAANPAAAQPQGECETIRARGPTLQTLDTLWARECLGGKRDHSDAFAVLATALQQAEQETDSDAEKLAYVRAIVLYQQAALHSAADQSPLPNATGPHPLAQFAERMATLRQDLEIDVDKVEFHRGQGEWHRSEDAEGQPAHHRQQIIEGAPCRRPFAAVGNGQQGADGKGGQRRFQKDNGVGIVEGKIDHGRQHHDRGQEAEQQTGYIERKLDACAKHFPPPGDYRPPGGTLRGPGNSETRSSPPAATTTISASGKMEGAPASAPVLSAFHRAARRFPGAEAADDIAYRRQPHALGDFRRQH